MLLAEIQRCEKRIISVRDRHTAAAESQVPAEFRFLI